jgi:hypothetical protein
MKFNLDLKRMRALCHGFGPWLIASAAAVMCCPVFLAVTPSKFVCPFAFASINEMPYLPEYGSGDQAYWDVVRKGKLALPDLLRCMDADVETSALVPNFGGHYTTGDIAFHAIMDIVHGLPVIEWTDNHDHPQFDNLGFGIYWSYVRSSPSNRMRLRKRCSSWLQEHDHLLFWHQEPDHPANGWYEVVK